MTGGQSHTPGPWQNGFDDLEGIVSLGAFDDGNVVCLPPSELMEQSLYRWPANARLIAAAPDLLEALKAQEELAALRFPGDPAEAIAKVRAMRRAAISKAEGEG